MQGMRPKTQICTKNHEITPQKTIRSLNTHFCKFAFFFKLLNKEACNIIKSYRFMTEQCMFEIISQA